METGRFMVLGESSSTNLPYGALSVSFCQNPTWSGIIQQTCAAPCREWGRCARCCFMVLRIYSNPIALHRVCAELGCLRSWDPSSHSASEWSRCQNLLACPALSTEQFQSPLKCRFWVCVSESASSSYYQDFCNLSLLCLVAFPSSAPWGICIQLWPVLPESSCMSTNTVSSPHLHLHEDLKMKFAS